MQPVCRKGKRTVGGVSDPGNLAQGIINASKNIDADIIHSPNNDKELSGNRKDLPTG